MVNQISKNRLQDKEEYDGFSICLYHFNDVPSYVPSYEQLTVPSYDLSRLPLIICFCALLKARICLMLCIFGKH